MDLTTSEATRQPRVFPVTPLRAYRLARGVALSDAARAAGATLCRASEVERGVGRRATEDEAAALRRGVDRVASTR